MGESLTIKGLKDQYQNSEAVPVLHWKFMQFSQHLMYMCCVYMCFEPFKAARKMFSTTQCGVFPHAKTLCVH